VPRGYAEGVRPLRRAEFDAYTWLLGGTIGVVPDVQALPNFHNAGLYVTFDIHTIAAASLRRKSDLIGTLNLVTYGPGRSLDHDARPVRQGLPDPAVPAITNARLFAAAQRRLRHTEALRRIDTTITGSLDLGPMLNTVLDEVLAQLGVDAADVLLFDRQTQRL